MNGTDFEGIQSPATSHTHIHKPQGAPPGGVRDGVEQVAQVAGRMHIGRRSKEIENRETEVEVEAGGGSEFWFWRFVFFGCRATSDTSTVYQIPATRNTSDQRHQVHVDIFGILD
jgi:hypothetical protein